MTVLLGSKQGIQSKGSRVLRGVRGTNHDDAFGSALRVADVDADAKADVVVLASGAQNRDGRAYAGSVSFCSGGAAGPNACQRLGRDGTGGRYASVAVGDGANGLARSGNRAFDQETPGVPGGSEEGDDFGAALTVVDRDLDGRADVVVGVPGKNDDLGRVVFLGATGTGLGGADRNSDQLSGSGYAERLDARYGSALA